MHKTKRASEGFTLIELLVVLGVLLLIALIGTPMMMNILARAKHESAVRNIASLARSARLQAVRYGTRAYLWADTANGQFALYREANGDDAFDPTTPGADRLVGTAPIPAPMTLNGPGGGGGTGFDGLTDDGGTAWWAEFLPSGAVLDTGGFRIADDAAADASNYLEIRIEPAATARVFLRKWDGAAWREQGEGGKSWKWN